MIELRFHGRGGQGAVTSAELLAHAAISEGRFAQSFPAFGPERRGAPVLAFARIDDSKIYLREQVYEPDVVIVLDAALLDIVDVAEGVKPDGVIVINSPEPPAHFKEKYQFKTRVATVNAQRIALNLLRRPIVNTTMLGGAIKARGLVRLESLKQPLEERFGALGARNFAVMERAFEELVMEDAS
ncbi:MAG: pyruvate ferredoxin oxidoreductase subunit gamma [Deltaproteobacteria bacterium]|nr:pyruvate ferredoxin oxidoreductase subunit gamma [Deltaproteobacteria bacterium]